MDRLPVELLIEIFLSLTQDSEGRRSVLISCRGVNKCWRTLIDNNSEIKKATKGREVKEPGESRVNPRFDLYFEIIEDGKPFPPELKNMRAVRTPKSEFYCHYKEPGRLGKFLIFSSETLLAVVLEMVTTPEKERKMYSEVRRKMLEMGINFEPPKCQIDFLSIKFPGEKLTSKEKDSKYVMERAKQIRHLPMPPNASTREVQEKIRRQFEIYHRPRGNRRPNPVNRN